MDYHLHLEALEHKVHYYLLHLLQSLLEYFDLDNKKLLQQFHQEKMFCNLRLHLHQLP
jgi:hypothetical protein